jgi:hypothetical protein
MAKQDTHIPLPVILHGPKEKIYRAQVLAWGFKMKITPTVSGYSDV